MRFGFSSVCSFEAITFHFPTDPSSCHQASNLPAAAPVLTIPGSPVKCMKCKPPFVAYLDAFGRVRQGLPAALLAMPCSDKQQIWISSCD